ncbi:MAG TPA: hypothetical protein PK760_10135, partial [Flavobacteriales bacterium]|nr:hypothetical protein [Flavobacteriales bacterium]
MQRGLLWATGLWLSISTGSNAQGNSILGPGQSVCRADGKVLPYAPLREADVMWERRVWRIIDLRDPENVALKAPQGKSPGCLNLMGVIGHGLRDEGGIVAYMPDTRGGDSAFTAPMDQNALFNTLTTMDSLPSDAVSRFMVKEDWI